jgi:RNA recognition motif-containing protein
MTSISSRSPSKSPPKEEKGENLFIGDLDENIKPQEIYEVFSRYGKASGLGLLKCIF